RRAPGYDTGPDQYVSVQPQTGAVCDGPTQTFRRRSWSSTMLLQVREEPATTSSWSSPVFQWSRMKITKCVPFVPPRIRPQTVSHSGLYRSSSTSFVPFVSKVLLRPAGVIASAAHSREYGANGVRTT